MQGQLGLDKKNPIITIQTTIDENYLIVFIGFLFYTMIPNNPASIQYRLLVGQLALAGFSITRLAEIFCFTRPTIMRYRDIIRDTLDESEMFAKLKGYNSEKTKLLPDVEAYIRSRFETVYRSNRASYNQQLRKEIFEKYQIKLSAEALRRVIAPLRQQIDNQEQIKPVNSGKDDSSSSDVSVDERASLNNQSTSDNDIAPIEAQISSSSNVDETTSEIATEVAFTKDTNKGEFFLYAGVLVLNFWLADFTSCFGNLSATLLQWLYQIFAGAVNFEQARYLSFNEFSRFIGKAAASVSKNRLFLSNLAYNSFEQILQMLFEVNLQCMKKHWENKSHYFYIDGHFDPYYGCLEILKGWCCIFNRAMKGTNHYTIHDMQGYLIYKELKDCFDDFRIYLKQAIAKIKSFMLGTPFGIVFDRGGFSEAMFADFNAEGVYFVTWEKYFDIEKESELKFDSSVVIEREINEVNNFKAVYFNCAETTYRIGESFSCRKIIIHTEQEDKHGQKSDFYASILTNDPLINHQLLVELMTDRWRCQENDYKYEKKHFGLDQITSYDVIPPKSIQSLIDEQKGNLDALKQEHTDIRAKQDKLYQQLGVKRLTQKWAKRIQDEAEQNPQMYECMVTLRALQPKLKDLTSQIKQLEKKIKRLEKIEKKGYVQLDYRKKQIFDLIRFTARNIFYKAVSEFRMYYTNLRDLHVVFWKLIRSNGYIQFEKEKVIVTLHCPFFRGRVLVAVKNFLEKLNQKESIILDGSNRKIVFFVKSEVANSSIDC